MNNTALTIIAAGLFSAWLFGPIVIVRYIWVDVQKRWEEIEDWFSATQETDVLPSCCHGKSGAWFYARSLKPDRKPTNIEALETLKDQFWHFQNPRRYILPLALLLVLSGLVLAFTGLWLANSLSSAVTSSTGTNVQLEAGTATKPANSLRSPKTDNVANKTEVTAHVESNRSTDDNSLTENKEGDNSATNNGAIANQKSGTIAKDTNATTKNEVPITLLGAIKMPFIMALLGAFVWSVYEILSRRKSGDLTPSELYDVAFRLVAAVPIGYAFSLLVLDTVPGFVAFAVSAFPLRDIRLFMRSKYLQKMGENLATTSPTAKGYMGELVASLGHGTVARLEELNIETYLDLAYTDPICLMVRTGRPIKLVLSWIDLALPAVYFPEQKVLLEKLGMPCAVDLCEFYTRHFFDVVEEKAKEKWQDEPAIKDLADELKLKANLLYQPFTSLYEDPNAKFLIGVSHQSVK